MLYEVKQEPPFREEIATLTPSLLSAKNKTMEEEARIILEEWGVDTSAISDSVIEHIVKEFWSLWENC